MKKQIKFSSLERFNLEDANDLQGLVDDHLTLQNYGLKGGASNTTLTGGMILSPFSANSVGAGNSTPNAWIALNPFNFMLPNGEVVEHTNGALQISYSTLRSAAISANAARTGYLWGNYNDVDTESEPREFWSPLDQAEVIQTVNTRTVKTPTFTITTTTGQPAAISGRLWTRLATVSVTSSYGTFKVVNTGAVKQYNELPGMLNYKPLEISEATRSTRFGLGTYWDNIEEMFNKIISNGSADDANKTAIPKGGFPAYSLQGLKREIDKKANIGVVAQAIIKFVPNTNFLPEEDRLSIDTNFYPYKRSDIVVSLTKCGCDPTIQRFNHDNNANSTFINRKNGIIEIVFTDDSSVISDLGAGQTMSTALLTSIYQTQRVEVKVVQHPKVSPWIHDGISDYALDRTFFPELTKGITLLRNPFAVLSDKRYIDSRYGDDVLPFAMFVNFEWLNMSGALQRDNIMDKYFSLEGYQDQTAVNVHGSYGVFEDVPNYNTYAPVDPYNNMLTGTDLPTFEVIIDIYGDVGLLV